MSYLYHIDVFMPEEYITKSLSAQRLLGRYYFSRHLNDYFHLSDYKHAINRKRLVECINNLRPCPIIPFEVEAEGEDIVKIVVRTGYSITQDVSIAIQLITDSGAPLIKTAWLNDKLDQHNTLDFSKYVDEETHNNISHLL